jgi:hypothetical protein
MEKINLSTTQSITTTYAGEFAGKYIAAALLSAPTLEKGGITIMPNVKFKQVIKRVATDDIIRNATCDFDPTSTVTLTERVLQPEYYQINLQLCKSDFRQDWDAIQMGYSAFDVLPKSFADFLIAHAAEKVAAGMETSIWQGVNSVAGQFAGIMTQLTTDAALPSTQEIAAVGGGVNASNVIAQLGSMIDALPSALYGKEDLTLYVSNNIYRAYVRALGGFAASGVGANGYDNKGTNQVLNDLYFDGVKVFLANGLAANTALLSQTSNLFFATSLMSDMNECKVLDMSDIDGSQNVRVVMRFSADAKYGFASDVVTYGITNNAN